MHERLKSCTCYYAAQHIVWGDILISLDGQRVNDSESVIEQLQSRNAGEEALLGNKRGDDFLRIYVRLASRPSTSR